jgi:dUTP pyrophosphatase
VTTSTAKSRARAATSAPTEAKAVTVAIKQLCSAEGMALPAYQTEQAAGLDLAAAISEGEGITVKPGGRVLVPTGLVLELPVGYEGQVRPRSGLALRHGVTVLNSPGTIDADYRGEVSVLLVNLGPEPVMIHRGDRIAQLVIAPVVRANLLVAVTVSETARGAGGFGSTGQALKAAAMADKSSISAAKSVKKLPSAKYATRKQK